jgi:hypothetical protein
MYYRAIKMIDGGKEIHTAHFEAIEDAYKWMKPSENEMIYERWHLKMLWALREEIERWPTSVPRVGYTDPMNPEVELVKDLYIQKVQHFDDPLPLL